MEKKLALKLFRDVIENKNHDETLIDSYLIEACVQIVDNQTVDFETFKKHIQNLFK